MALADCWVALVDSLAGGTRNVRNYSHYITAIGELKVPCINYQLDCNSNNVVYLLTCKVCGLQYVGSTSTKFRLRFNNHMQKSAQSSFP